MLYLVMLHLDVQQTQEILEQQQQNKMLTLALQQQLALASPWAAFRPTLLHHAEKS